MGSSGVGFGDDVVAGQLKLKPYIYIYCNFGDWFQYLVYIFGGVAMHPTSWLAYCKVVTVMNSTIGHITFVLCPIKVKNGNFHAHMLPSQHLFLL